MNKDQFERKPSIIIGNSPVPFVIMGPKGVHRQVLIKSSDAPLDLIVQDTFVKDGKSIATSQNLFKNIAKVFNGNIPLRNYVVRSKTFVSVKNERTVSLDAHHLAYIDNRLSFLSFAWRGVMSKEDRQKISSTFSDTVPDIYSALELGSDADIEWTLAPLLAQCRDFQEQYSEEASWRRFLFLSTFIVYLSLFLLIASKIFDRLTF